MLLFSLGALIPSPPKFNPPATTTRCRHRLSPLHSISVTADAAPAPLDANNDSLVHFLIDSIGFTRAEAISASTKLVNPLRQASNPQSILKLLHNYGFNDSEIKEIVYFSPRILSKKDEILDPKIKFFLQHIGFSHQDFVKLIKKNPSILKNGLDTCLIPTYNFLKQLSGGDHDKVIKTIRDSPYSVLAPSKLKRMQLYLQLLRDYGIADELIRNFMIRYPGEFIMHRPERYKDAISRVDKELGIPHDSPMVFRGISTLAMVSKPNMQKKYEIFKSFGWTDSDIKNMGRKQPFSLMLSEDNLRKALEFFIEEVGFKPEFLAFRPILLMYSLEKRVKPRYEVWKILKESELMKHKQTFTFYSLVYKPESRFFSEYVLPYKDTLPNLYEFYCSFRKQESKD